MKCINVLFWYGQEPASISFMITEKYNKEDILNIIANSDMEIIRIDEK